MENKMGKTYRMLGKDEKCVQNVGRKTWREETTRKT